MYRTDLHPRDKGGAIAAVIAIHAGIAFALLHLSGQVTVQDLQQPLRVFDINEAIPPPPPPPPPPPKQAQQPKPKKEEGGSAPNIKSEATPIVAPKPRIPIKSPVAVSETPAQGTAPTQGAAPVRGPGTGSGGIGTGTGGGSGAGPGGGGGGGRVVSRARLATPVLTGRNFSRELLRAWPRRADILMRLRVDANGGVIQCIVDRGTGNPQIDAEVCAQARRYLRFHSAHDDRGLRVADWFGYRQAAPR